MKCFTITTYNCKHFNQNKLSYINFILKSCDFLLIQEHCLYQSQLYKLCNVDTAVSFCGNSQMDETKHLVGRPFGGVAIIWKNSIILKFLLMIYLLISANVLKF